MAITAPTRSDPSLKYNLEFVQKIILDTKLQILMEFVKAINSATLGGSVNYKTLVETHTIKDIVPVVWLKPNNVSSVYERLVPETRGFIKKQAMQLVPRDAELAWKTFKEIEREFDNSVLSSFFCSFVLRATEPMVEKLEKEQPGAINDPKIWWENQKVLDTWLFEQRKNLF